MKKIIIGLIFVPFILSASIKTGSEAPDFELMDSYNNKVKLSSFQGKRVILEWTNHGCPFVDKHYKTGNMQNTQIEAKENDYIWLSIISSAPGTQGYVSSQEANQLTSSRDAQPSHVLFDPEGIVGKSYGAKTTPHMYIIDKRGSLRYQGAIDDAGGRGFMFKDLSQATNYVKEAIKEINENRKISFPATKPYGCSVKYKS